MHSVYAYTNPEARLLEATQLFRPTQKNDSHMIRLLPLAWALSLATLPSAGITDIAPTSASAELPQLLEQQGWQAQEGADGATLYRPPEQIIEPDLPESANEAVAQPPSIPYRQLKDSGWTVRVDGDGNTLLIPAGRAAPTGTVGEAAIPATAGTPAAPPDIQRLLRDRGWRLEQDASGNTILTPANAGTSTSGTMKLEETANDSGDTETATTADPFSQFQRSLRKKGWRVESAPDGAVLVYPPISGKASDAYQADAAPAQRGHYKGIESATVLAGEVALPVDNEAEAGRIARDWVERFGSPEQVVGRIRRVNDVHIVSIVDETPPYRLRNQLIILTETGRVIAIY